MTRERARSTIVTVTVALVAVWCGGWLLAKSTLVDRMYGQPDIWAIFPVLFMALRLFVIVGAPPLTVVALWSLVRARRRADEAGETL